MRWLSRSHVRVKAEVRSRGWLVWAMLGAMVLIAGYALYDAWYRPHWPGEVADLDELDAIVGGQTYHPDLTCKADGATCLWQSTSPCSWEGDPCGSCTGEYHWLCQHPLRLGWICLQYEDGCCQPPSCVKDPDTGELVCDPTKPHVLFWGSWYWCRYQ